MFYGPKGFVNIVSSQFDVCGPLRLLEPGVQPQILRSETAFEFFEGPFPGIEIIESHVGGGETVYVPEDVQGAVRVLHPVP